MRRPHHATLARLGLALAVAVAAASGAVPGLQPGGVRATTADTMEDQILGLVNQSRAAKGLVALRSDVKLRDLAGYRAGVMASTGVLSHSIAGCLSCQLSARGIQWYLYGEVIAWTSYPYGSQAASAIFNWWKNSSTHWALLMSSKFNYIGVGVAYRSANATSWSSIVLTESADHTAPWASMASPSYSGTTAYWRWSGGDTRLQTHTAGLKNFDVQYRVDSGTWSTIRSATTLQSLSLTGRAHGHWYGLRVRGRDNLGYLSPYSAESRVWVP